MRQRSESRSEASFFMPSMQGARVHLTELEVFLSSDASSESIVSARSLDDSSLVSPVASLLEVTDELLD